MKLSAGFLRSESLIHLRGNAVPEFLQGQLSCDTRRLDDSSAVNGALCNVKGRVLSDLLLIRLSGEHCLLRLRASVAATIVETLSRYAQFSRITVELEPGEDAVAGLLGEPAALQEACAGLPEQPGGWVLQEERILLRRSAGQAELLPLGERARETLRRELAAMNPLSETRWQSTTLLGGHYAIEAVDAGLYTPQALNYDLSGRVAFDKGCYTGQEVIARLHYKGRSKRRLQVYRCSGDADAAAGAAIVSDAGDSVGKVLRVEEHSPDEKLLAAEVSADLIGSELRLEGGADLRAVDLDYPVPAS